LNAAFFVDPLFRKAFLSAINEATREELNPDERGILDGYCVSVTNIFTQLAGEVREGLLDSASVSFGGEGLFSLPYYRTSWGHYRNYLSPDFIEPFEKAHSLDPNTGSGVD
jgi:hypothetical protein